MCKLYIFISMTVYMDVNIYMSVCVRVYTSYIWYAI